MLVMETKRAVLGSRRAEAKERESESSMILLIEVVTPRMTMMPLAKSAPFVTRTLTGTATSMTPLVHLLCPLMRTTISSPAIRGALCASSDCESIRRRHPRRLV